ncbi:MAG: hypothetical protein Q7J75_06380 [Rhodoferax sp.]|nr:hypothetical protein [Rhodoferax sp.]
MNLTLKIVALAFTAFFALAVSLLVGSYAGTFLPLSKAGEFNWWWAISGSTGSIAGATIAAPFLVVLFERRRWCAALFVVLPYLVVNDVSNFSRAGAFLAFSYFSLLMIGIWISSRVLTSVQRSNMDSPTSLRD